AAGADRRGGGRPGGAADPAPGELMRLYLQGLLPYYRHVLGTIAIGSVCGLIMNTSVVLPPILLGRAIDTVNAVANGDAAPVAVGWAALAYLGGVLLMESARAVKRWCLERTIPRMRSNIQADAFRGVLAWPMARLHTSPIGGLMARIIGDAEVIRRGTDQLTVEVWDTFLMLFSLAAALFVYDWQLSAIALLPLPLAVVLAHTTGRWIRERTVASREANAVLTAALQEDLVGLRVLRLFGRRDAAVERVAALSRHQADANVAQARLEGALRPLYGAVMSVGVIAVVWQGGERVLDGAMTLGTFVGYLELYLRFVQQGIRLPQVANAVQAAAAAWGRIAPLLAPALPVRGEPPFASFFPGHISGIARVPPPPPEAPPGPLAVLMEQVTLRYPGTPLAAAPALDGVSLEVPAGSLVGVTGPVGSGKSTLARALMGLYPLERGRVLLGGRPVEGLAGPERAARAGYLPQEPFLFSGTVRENVLVADPAEAEAWPSAVPAPERLRTAVEIAALDGDLAAFPEGVESEIGESGVRVSGGQRQRIALARALASQRRTPGLLVLDDPFSAVDVDTEARIASALREAFGPTAPVEDCATIVLCSHRLAVFPQADQIVVLDGGRVAE
ncbi:MAG TPA: ABC transporter ATP-binding protein, partial [Candidatus Limnocylindria bacterium]